MPIQFDTSFIRQQFPAFSEASLQGQAFFENAGGSYSCRQVIDLLTVYYHRTKVQPYGYYPASIAAGKAMDHAYVRMADYLNVDAGEIHIGPSTSQNTYVLAQAFRRQLRPGDEIIVSNQDHEANSGVWRRLSEEGLLIREWLVNPETGILDQTDLDRLLNDKTRLVVFPHCSNIVAWINPVREIVDRIHAAGAIAVVDAVSYAGHGYPDLTDLDADVYLFSTYKTYGPHQGVMVLRRHLIRELPNQGHYFNDGDVHKRLLPAGPDHAQIAAVAGIADYFDAVYAHHFQMDATKLARAKAVHDLFRQQETKLLQPLLDFLENKKQVRLLGSATASKRAPTVSFVHNVKASQDIVRDLAAHGIMAGAGHFYAKRLVEALGIDGGDGVVRLSFVHYTSESEIEQLLQALDNLL